MRRIRSASWSYLLAHLCDDGHLSTALTSRATNEAVNSRACYSPRDRRDCGRGSSFMSVLRPASSVDLRTLVWAWSVLIIMGATWGLSFSLARIAAMGGAHPLGIAFWECSIAGLLLICLVVYRRIPLTVTARLVRFNVTTGLVGMVIPGAAFFYAAAHLPSGVLSIALGTVPVMTYVASAVIGLEKPAMGRLFGVVLGTLAVVLLVAPESSLPDPMQVPWMVLGFVAAACYAALNLI